MVPVIVLALACAPSPEAPPSAAPAIDPQAEAAHAEALAVAARVELEVDCATSTERYLCPAARLPGEAFEPAAAPGTWLGSTVAVRRSRALEDGAAETVALSQLTVDTSGVSVTSVRPTTADESLVMGSVLTNVAKATRGAAPRVEVPQGLYDYLVGPQRDATRWPLVRDAHGWSFTGKHPGRVYRVPASGDVPAAFVVVEVAPYGDFLSVFPDVPILVPDPALAPLELDTDASRPATGAPPEAPPPAP